MLSAILAATYLGGMDSQEGVGSIAVDGARNVYVAGSTLSSDFPGVGPESADSTIDYYEGFVAKLDSHLSAPCGGKPVTLFGTASNDTLYGAGGADVIHGLGGNDTIYGLGGRDVLCGGAGNDTLRGGYGLDFLYGGGGADWLFGEAGKDYLRGAGGRDQLFGGAENDDLHGGSDDDVLNGEARTEVCDGGRHLNGDTAVQCETIRNVP